MKDLAFEKIHADWEPFIAAIPDDQVSPFLQGLERLSRAAGRPGEADDIYYERRCIEFRQRCKRCRDPRSWPAILGSGAYRGIAGYGVGSFRYILFVAALVVLGAIIFSQPNAVVSTIAAPAPDQSSIADNYYSNFLSIGAPVEFSAQRSPSFYEAVGVSLNQVIPLLVVESDFKPSRAPFIETRVGSVTFAGIGLTLTILGLILVPLSLAVLVKWLRREPSS